MNPIHSILVSGRNIFILSYLQGAKSALDDFQFLIGQLFKDVRKIKNIADDILIGGRTQEEHDERLELCLLILL